MSWRSSLSQPCPKQLRDILPWLQSIIWLLSPMLPPSADSCCRRGDSHTAEELRGLLSKSLDACISKLAVLRRSLPRLISPGITHAPLPIDQCPNSHSKTQQLAFLCWSRLSPRKLLPFCLLALCRSQLQDYDEYQSRNALSPAGLCLRVSFRSSTR